ncbi:MAG: SulP family inorganic anion transporter [Gammaproteobacteria bacterium]
MKQFSLNRLTTRNLRGDLLGGLTAAVIALPLAVAFGVASGAGPVAGLYGAICVGFFAALFGGTPSQISGPTGPMTIVFASVFSMHAQQPAVAFTVVVLAGAFQILFGTLKLGRYINLMPYPVISGFMTGIGCILIIMQLEPLLGYQSPTSVSNAISVLPDQLLAPNWHAVAIGSIALLICLFTPAPVSRRIPPSLLALAVSSLLVVILDEASVIGKLPTGFPDFVIPLFVFDSLNEILVSAVVLAILGSMDSLLTSLAADNVTRSFHDSDKELVGQGIGNLVAGFVGALPGAGATIRTLSNIKAGGRTALSGISHSSVLLIVVLGFGRGLEFIPHAALAGILIKVGVDVIDWRYLRLMGRAPNSDFMLMLIVLMLTVFVDVITAVAVGFVLAALTFVKESAEVQMESIKALSDPDHAQFLNHEEAALFRRCNAKLLFLYLSGLMSFGAAKELTRRLAQVSSFEVLLIDLSEVPRVDGSAALALGEVVERAIDAEQDVILVGLSADVARLLGRMHILDRFHETKRFSSRLEALAYAARQLETSSATDA